MRMNTVIDTEKLSTILDKRMLKKDSSTRPRPRPRPRPKRLS